MSLPLEAIKGRAMLMVARRNNSPLASLESLAECFLKKRRIVKTTKSEIAGAREKVRTNANKIIANKIRLGVRLALKRNEEERIIPAPKNPAKEFGWENVEYARRSSLPPMFVRVIPGAERLNALSPR